MFGFLKKKSKTYNLDELVNGLAGWGGWGTSSGTYVTEKTAIGVPAVFCAARVIAEGVAQVPVRVMIDTYAGDLRQSSVAREHWAHKLLSKRPNNWQTSYEFREGMLLNAAIGSGAIAIKNQVRGEVRELLPVPSGSWSVEQLSDFQVRFRVDYSDKTHGYFDRTEVLYIRGPSLDGLEALPVIKQAREAIGLSQGLERQQAKLAGNGGKPSGVLGFTDPLKPETIKKLEETWQAKFGPNGEGGVAILDGGASYQSMVMTSVDAQHIETRRFQIEEIARAFRLQPIMLMQSDKAMTFASAEQMFRMHSIHSLGPWFRRFEEAVDRDILAGDDDLRCDLDERGLTRGDFKDQSEYYTKALGAGGQPGWMTPNEIRVEQGMNPSDDPWANQIPQGAMNPKEDDNADVD